MKDRSPTPACPVHQTQSKQQIYFSHTVTMIHGEKKDRHNDIQSCNYFKDPIKDRTKDTLYPLVFPIGSTKLPSLMTSGTQRLKNNERQKQ